MELTFTLKGDKELEATLGKYGKNAPVAAGMALYPEGELIASRGKDLVSVDMGALRASIHAEQPVVANNKATVTIGAGGPSAKYALIVHEGAGPAVGHNAWMPPTEALKGWAARHGIPEKLLFVLARSIGRKGFVGKKYIERPFTEAQQGMEGRIAAQLQRWLESNATR